MKKIVLLLGIVFTLSFMSCTENARVKSFGGKGEVMLEEGQQLEMVTWKSDQLWILTKNRPDSVKPQTHKFYEESSWGVMEGEYIIIEH